MTAPESIDAPAPDDAGGGALPQLLVRPFSAEAAYEELMFRYRKAWEQEAKLDERAPMRADRSADWFLMMTVLSAPSPAPMATGGKVEPLRPCGYFWSLEPTGDQKIDDILRAIHRAARASHHTEDWDEEITHGVPSVLADIQTAANAAATSPTRVGDGEVRAAAMRAAFADLTQPVPPGITAESYWATQTAMPLSGAGFAEKWDRIALAALRAFDAGGGDRIDGVGVREAVFRALDDATQGGPALAGTTTRQGHPADAA